MTFDTMDELIKRHSDFLEDQIEQDFGLLDKLRERGALSLEEISKIKDNCYLHERNSYLLHYILKNRKGDDLLWALRHAEQTHIANYLLANGEYKPEFGGEWPLTANEISILDDTNRESLADILDLSDLLGLLLSRNVINRRQLDLFFSTSTSHGRSETLLEILRRCSRNEYMEMIACVHQTNQSHIAEILEKGGALVKVHATPFGDEVEQNQEGILTRCQIYQISKTAEATIFIMTDFHIIAVAKGPGVVLYFHCMSLNDLVKLREMQITGKLKTAIKEMFSQLLFPSRFSEVTAENLNKSESGFSQLMHRSQIPSLTVTLSEEDYKKGRSLFPGNNAKRRKLVTAATEQNGVSSTTTVYELPLEMLDIILQKSYLHCILYSSTKQRDKDVIRSLMSVDVCFHKRITVRRFRKTIWCYMKGMYTRVNEQ